MYPLCLTIFLCYCFLFLLYTFFWFCLYLSLGMCIYSSVFFTFFHSPSPSRSSLYPSIPLVSFSLLTKLIDGRVKHSLTINHINLSKNLTALDLCFTGIIFFFFIFILVFYFHIIIIIIYFLFVDLLFVGIGDAGGCSIISQLSKNPQLTYLKLDGQDLKPQAGFMLANLLKDNMCNLTYLNINEYVFAIFLNPLSLLILFFNKFQQSNWCVTGSNIWFTASQCTSFIFFPLLASLLICF